MNLRVTNENQTHGVPAFQIEMTNMASPAGRTPVRCDTELLLIAGLRCLRVNSGIIAPGLSASDRLQFVDLSPSRRHPSPSRSLANLAYRADFDN